MRGTKIRSGQGRKKHGMDSWLDFIQVALVLGLGWLGWVLFTVTRTAGRAVASVQSQARRTSGRDDQLLTNRRRL